MIARRVALFGDLSLVGRARPAADTALTRPRSTDTWIYLLSTPFYYYLQLLYFPDVTRASRYAHTLGGAKLL